MTVIEIDDLQEPTADFSQLREADNYIRWSLHAFARIDFSQSRKVCVFNCSDGPSAYGMITAINRTSPCLCYLLADQSPQTVVSCQGFIFDRGVQIVTQPLILMTEGLIKKVRLVATDEPVDTFVAFEPVGKLERDFEAMMSYLAPGGKIVIAARGSNHSSHRALERVGRGFNIEPQFFKQELIGLQEPLVSCVLEKPAAAILSRARI